MEFKYSFSILFSNMGYVFKILFWMVMSLLLSGAIGFAILIPIWNALAPITNVTIYLENIKNIFESLLNDGIILKSVTLDIINNVKNLLFEINSQPGLAAAFYLVAIFINAMFGFMFGISYLPMTDIIDKFMTSNMRFGLLSSAVVNLKKSMEFSFKRLLLSLPIDFITFFVIFTIALILYPKAGILTLAVMVILAVTLISLKDMLFACWLPKILYSPDEGVYTSLSRSFTYVKHNFLGYFKSFCLTTAISYLVIAAVYEETFGVIILLIIPIYYFLIRSIELIGYFKQQQFSFYVDATNVINTVEYGYRRNNQDEEQGD